MAMSLFHGDLNDVRLYRSGLNGLQIQSIASGEKGIAGDELMGSWSLPDEAKPKVEQPVEKIAHERIEKFLLKAFHSPADEKTGKLYARYFDKQYQKSGDFTRSMKDVVSAALASPRFIFVHNERDEVSPNQASFNLATRLSMFLWSSIPDEELLELAANGELQNVDVLGKQVDRMLNHHRVKNFCDSFAPQWLKLNNLVSASPDFKSHRDYYFGGDDKISYKRGMHMMLEPLLNFETVFIENRPISELVDSDFTYRSHLLSEWYQGQGSHLFNQRKSARYRIHANSCHGPKGWRCDDDRSRYGNDLQSLFGHSRLRVVLGFHQSFLMTRLSLHQMTFLTCGRMIKRFKRRG
jgi:hypothetical protein